MDKPGSILVNEDALAESYMPAAILHREEQIRQIINALSPALYNKSINNLFVTGPAGCGKTLIVKWILQQKFAGKSAYINCWNKRTEHKILEELLLRLGVIVHGRESTDELARMLSFVKKKAIICLDEGDQMKNPNVLYTLARYGFGIVLISNRPFSGWKIDSRIKSSLLLKEIEFKPYVQEELIQIVTERVNSSLSGGSVSAQQIERICKLADGDARIALLILKSAAKNAEAKRLSSISGEDIEQAGKGASKLIERANKLVNHLGSLGFDEFRSLL